MEKSDPPLRLAAHGLSAKDLAVLRSLLSLYRDRLSRECLFCYDNASAELHLVDVDEPTGLAAWEALRDNSRCIVFSHQTVEAPLLLSKPLRGPTLLAVLGEALANTPQAPVTPSTVPELGVTVPVATRQGTLIDLLETGVIDTYIRIEAPGYDEDLWIDPDLKQYLLGSSLSHLRDFLRSSLQPWQIQRVSHEEYRAHAQHIRPKTLMRLRWFSALACSDGELIPAFDRSCPFQLTTWPDMEGHLPIFFRLAGLLVKQAATFDGVIKMTGVDSATAADFVNASYRCGLTRQVAPRGGNASAFSSAGRSLVSRLRERLGL